MQALPRSLFIFAFCIPLALILGVLLANPLDRTTMMMVGAGFFLLLIPLLLTSHQAFLILSCQAYVNVYFLPGSPQLWLLAAAISCGFAILTLTLNRGKIKVLNIPSVTWALVFMLVVTIITAQATGGVGARVLGSGQYGGRRYVALWGAIAAYFAISAFPLMENKRKFLTGGYFLSAATSVMSNFAYTLGPSFYFLFLLFPAELAVSQALSDDTRYITRISGTGPAAVAIISFMLLKHGVRGSLSIIHFWRPLIIIGALVAGLFSGFRSILVFSAMLFFFQFLAEGLHRTRYLPIVAISLVLISATVIPIADRLPLSVQRCLTVFPIKLDPSAMQDAKNSTEWRMDMWRAILPDIPNYFWLGKGFVIDPKDLWFAQEGTRRGVADYEGAMIAGDYHSGPLTLLLPFGIWGVIAFLWFTIAGARVLWFNMKNSEPDMKRVNTFLFSYFVAKWFFYVFFFGAFYVDILFFTTTVALSIAVNRGVRKTAEQPALVPATAKKDVVLPSGGRLLPA